MRVRIIDYVGSLGGGIRFCAEMLRVLTRMHPEADFELVSYGPCLQRYKDILESAGLSVPSLSLKPRHAWRNVRNYGILAGRRGSIVTRMLNPVTQWAYEVPAEAFLGCDRVWMPWVHWHETGTADLGKVVASFHDAIIFDVAGIFAPWVVAQERRNIANWLASDARIVVSSRATAERLSDLFHNPESRVQIMRLSGDHALAPATAVPNAAFPWISRPYLLCPANITKHKNHEVLFEGTAMWGKKHPLVLTGEGSNLGFGRRAWHLRRYANRLGLASGTSLQPLGYVPDDQFRVILGRAWALVIASRAEGGGSFPVWEALVNGIPVVCAESAAVKEQVEWSGAQVLWFDPDSPRELAERLTELESGYDRFKARAMAQRAHLRRRSWEDVARDYWDLLTGRTG